MGDFVDERKNNPMLNSNINFSEDVAINYTFMILGIAFNE